jgi:transposase
VVAARMRANSTDIVENKTLLPDVSLLKEYLRSLGGSKIIAIEETTTSQWLYVELFNAADRIIICDPYRNGLMKDGPKNDKKDAGILCKLLRNGLLKEVYHSNDELFELRKFVSAYEDFVQASVRMKNQQSAFYRAIGKSHKKDKGLRFKGELLNFVNKAQSEAILYLKESREGFVQQMERICKRNGDIRRIRRISGIGKKLAIKIAAIVIDIGRFENKYKFWSYCGLIKYERESGGRIYGKKRPRYCRTLKGAFKSAAMSAISGNNDIRDYYEYLIKEGLSYKNAQNEIARYIAKSVYGVMKYKTEYRSYQWQENKKIAA